MSSGGKVIDNRIVEMQFDNRNFESNVQTSLGTLDKLKKSLNFDSAISGLGDLSNATSKLNFGGLADSINSVKGSFSAWEAVAFSAINKVTTQVIELGERIVKSLTLDQITAGWSKYEQKVTSVQTIMAATATTWEKEAEALAFDGTQMEFVTEQLEKLNWFSDETSYSFTDMTSNIGKFTSSGVALNEAVTAMEGISVWAAKSGQTTQSASRAYYNLAQALAVGSVKLIDWKSIENANMATKEFKQTALDTATELKYLKKVGDGLYKTTKGSTITVENFNEALSEGWFSSEVLMETLEKYGKAATLLSEVYEEYGITATSFLSNLDKYNAGTRSLEEMSEELGISIEELTPLIENLNSKEYELGLSAFRAAQEAKTFTEAMEATKDAVSTGWMRTFDLIFGNYEQAKVVWTELAERLWDVFAAGGDARNAVLQLWASGGGRDTLIDSFWELWDVVDSFASIVSEAFGEIFPHDIKSSAKKLLDFTDKLREFVKGLAISEETAGKLKTFFKGLFAALDILKNSLKVVTIPLKTIFDLLSGGSGTILDYAESLGQWLINLRGFLKTTYTFEHAGQRISNAILKIVDVVKYYQQMINDYLASGESGMMVAFRVISDIFLKIVGGILYGFQELTGIDMTKVIENLQNCLTNFANNLSNISKKVSFKTIVDNIKNFVIDVKEKIKDFSKIDLSPIENVFNKIRDILAPVNTSLNEKMSKIVDLIKEFGKGIYDAFSDSNFDNTYNMLKSGLLMSLTGGITAFFASLVSAVSSGEGILSTFKKMFSTGFKNFSEDVTKITTGMKEILGGVKGYLTSLQEEVKTNIILKIALAIGIITLSVIALSSIDQGKFAKAIASLTAEFGDLIATVKLLSMVDLAKITGVSKVFISLGISVLLLSFAVKKLGEMDTVNLIKGVVAVGALSGILVGVSKSLSNMGPMMKGVGSIILFALAIQMLSKPVIALGALDLGSLLKGLLGVLVLMEGLSLFMQETKFIFSGMGPKMAIGLIGMAAAILILSKAVQEFSKMDFVELVKGLSAFALVLYGVGEFMKATKDIKNAMSIAVSLTIIGAALLIMASAIEKLGSLDIVTIGKGLAGFAVALYGVVMALKKMPLHSLESAGALAIAAGGILILAAALKVMGSMKIEEIGKALLLLFGSLVMIVASANLMKDTMGAAAAMFVMASALAMLVPVLYAFGKLSLGEIAKSLLTLVGVFVILGVGSKLLAKVVPEMNAVATSFLLFGVATTLLGAGLLLISAGLAGLAVSVGAAAGALLIALKVILQELPDILKTLLKIVLEALEILFDEGQNVLVSFAAFVEKTIEVTLDTIHNLTPRIARFLKTDLVVLIDALLECLEKNIPRLLIFIIKFFEEVRAQIDPLTEQIVGFLLDSLDAIAARLPEIVDRIISFVVQLINATAQALDDHTEELKEAVIRLASSAAEAVLEFLGFSDEEAKKMVELGKNIIGSLVKGFDKAIMWVTEGLSNIIDEIKFEFTNWCNEFKKFGENIIQGLIDGIELAKKKVIEPIENLGDNIKNAFTKKLKIQSPSKVFESYGEYIDMGLINGISKLTGKVEDTTEDLGDSLISEMESPMQKLLSFMEDPTYSPTITPVLDTSMIDSQMNTISGLGNSRTIGLAAYNQNAVNTTLSRKFGDPSIQTTSPDVVTAINGLKQDIFSISKSISNLYVRLDTGAMVGALTPSINETMGQFAKYRARGN